MARTENTKKVENGVITSFEVTSARQYKDTVFFTLVLNGVTINNCKVVRYAKGDFISLPNHRGSDGKYYNDVWFRFSDEDTREILDDVEAMINK